MRQIRFYTFLLTFLIGIAACTPSVPEPPATIFELPSETPTITPTPEPTSTPGIVPETIATDPNQQAYLRIIHAAPDTSSVDVNVEMLTIIRNLRFQMESGPLGLVAGDYALRVMRTDAAPDENPILAETRISIAGGQTLLVVFTGTPDALTVSAFTESTEPLNANESRITLIHAVPGVSDITAQRNGFPIGPAVPFGQTSAPIVVPSQETTLDLVNGSTPLLSYPITLRERYNYTLVLVGSAADLSNLSIIEFNNRAPGRVDIRAVNVVTPIDSVLDVYLDTVSLASHLPYGQASPRQPITDETYTLTVYNAGADRNTATPLVSSQLSANADETITLVLLGSSDKIQVLTYRENLAPTSPNEFRIAFLNPLETVPVARITTTGGALPGVPDMSFAQSPFQTNLQAGTYTLYWNRVENSEPADVVEISENLEFEAGRNYLYILTGRFDNLPLILSDSVGIDETISDFSVDITPSPTPEIPTQIRFVNGIANGTTIAFRVNGTVVIPEISFGLGSELTTVPSGDYNLDITLPGADSAITNTDAFFDIASRYTIVAYGPNIEEARLLVMPDFNLILGEQSPHVRLINLSPSVDSKFTLAYGPPTSTARSGDLASFGEGVYRQSFSFGIEPLNAVNTTEAGSFSNVSLIPAGTHNIYIIDTTVNQIAANIQNVTINETTHYDVFAFQERDSLRVRGFILAYPAFAR